MFEWVGAKADALRGGRRCLWDTLANLIDSLKLNAVDGLWTGGSSAGDEVDNRDLNHKPSPHSNV